MKYTVEMSSGAIIYIPGLIKTGCSIQKLMARDTHTEIEKAK
jgi:hypothetical protein